MLYSLSFQQCSSSTTTAFCKRHAQRKLQQRGLKVSHMVRYLQLRGDELTDDKVVAAAGELKPYTSPPQISFSTTKSTVSSSGVVLAGLQLDLHWQCTETELELTLTCQGRQKHCLLQTRTTTTNLQHLQQLDLVISQTFACQPRSHLTVFVTS